MQARIGDQVIIEGHKIGTKHRRGEVRRVGRTTLTVAWDDGHETVFAPGPDCRIVPPSEAGERGETDRFGASIDLTVVEDDEQCHAVATLLTQRGTFEGRGAARRHPNDPNIPVIGEELAVGRALQALSEDLLDEAARGVARRDAPRAAHLLG